MNGGRRRLLALPLIAAAIAGLIWFVRWLRPAESGTDLFSRGLAQIDAGEAELARETTESLGEEPEFDQHARLLSAVLALREGNLDLAVSRFRDLPPEGPLRPEILFYLGELMYRRGELDVALMAFRALLAERTEPFDTETLYQLSQAYRQAGRDDDAERIAKQHSEATALYDEMTALSRQALADLTNRDIRIRLAEICRQLGKNELAAAWDHVAQNVSR